MTNRFPRVTIAGPASPATPIDVDALTQALQLRGSVVRCVSALEADQLGETDVVILLPGSDLEASVSRAIEAGLGLVAIGDVSGLGILGVETHPATPGSAAPSRTELAWPRPDLTAWSAPDQLRATTGFAVGSTGLALLGTPEDSALAACDHGTGRVVLIGGDPTVCGADLIVNAVHHVARSRASTPVESPLAHDPDWLDLKQTVVALRDLQSKDGSITESGQHATAQGLVQTICELLPRLSVVFPHDADYLSALAKDFDTWCHGGFGVPDFHDSLVAFAPAQQRGDGVTHLVLFPMYTQNGSAHRLFEAVLIEVIWPDFVADLQAGDYSNALFLPIRFIDFTPGYDNHSAVLFPETIAMRAIPAFTWGGIFADREAARFRLVVSEAARFTRLALPPDVARMLEDQALTEETFVMWDLIHDRTHMRGDLPFDPFMIKQRMPYFLYSLEELRCDLTAFREAVKLEQDGLPHARLVQYTILLDRIFRFSITGPRVRNYDGLGGQLLFAWLHQAGVLHWTDNRLRIEWDRLAEQVLALGTAIEELYWRSIDRPKVSHWLAAYDLVSRTVEPHPASTWARGKDALPVTGPLKDMTDQVLDDEFPLSMFFEALSKKMAGVVESTAGITG